jgi:hypothetical protein
MRLGRMLTTLVEVRGDISCLERAANWRPACMTVSHDPKKPWS